MEDPHSQFLMIVNSQTESDPAVDEELEIFRVD